VRVQTPWGKGCT